MRATVGKKLLWSIGIPGILMVLLGVAFYWRQADKLVQTSLRDQANAVAEVMTTTFTLTEDSPPSAQPDRAAVHRVVSEAVRSDWRLFDYVKELRILDPQGVVVWSRRADEEGKKLGGAQELLARAARPEDGRGGRAEVVRPLGGPSCAGCHAGTAANVGVLQLTINEPKLQREVTRVFQGALASVFLFALGIVVATALSLHFFLRVPLRQLASAMRRAEEGELVVRARVAGGDEISQLARSFNQMLARITELKVVEIDTQRDLQLAQEKLSLKAKLEDTNLALERRVKELTLIYDVARSFTSTLALPELLARMTELLVRRLEIPSFSILLATAERKLEVKLALPAGTGAEGLTMAFGEGACGMAAESRAPVYLPDIVRDGTRYARRRPGDTGSLLAVPMTHKEVVVGVLSFQRPEIHAFSEEEIQLLTAVADQAALAVQNAELHQQMVNLSLTDALTGAPNRRFLFSRLEMEIARANRFGSELSLLMIDIDHFKHLNDTAGHLEGDEVLRRVFQLLRGVISKVDTLARYGGEEFMVLLAQVPKQEAVNVGERLRRAIAEEPFPYGKLQPDGKITISVGVASLPVDSTELEKLVDCADSALYASKRGGRDRVTAYAVGMELHPGRERGPNAQKRLAAAPGPLPASGRAA